MMIQFLLTIVLAFALLMTWRRFRQHAIRGFELLFWSAVWVLAGIVVWRPEFSSAIARVVGVGRGADLVVYSSIVLLFILTFQLFVQHDRVERSLTQLVRHDALRDLVSKKSDPLTPVDPWVDDV